MAAAGVALEQQPVADEDPAGLPRRDRLALLVHDAYDGRVRRLAGGAGCLAQVPRGGHRRVGDLGRAVDVVERVAEPVHPGGGQVAGHRGAGRRDRLDRRQVVPVEGLVGQLQDPLQHHRDHHQRVAAVLLGDGEHALGVEAPGEDDGRAEQHAEREVGIAPGVEQRRRDVGLPAGLERHPRQQRDGGVDAGLVARGALGGAGGARGQDDDAAVALGRLEVVGRPLGDQLVEGLEALGEVGLVAVHPGQHPVVGLGLPEQVGELLVVDDERGLLALEHVDELRTGERGVQVEHVGAQLGHGQADVDEAPVVAAHHRDAVALADPTGLERGGERVAAPVDLTERQRPQVVDQPDLVGPPQRQRREAAGGAGPPLLERLAQPDERPGRVGADDPRSGEHRR